MKRVCPLLATTFALAAAPCALAQSAGPDAENTGQDPTRPITRVDGRLKYQDNPGGASDEVLTLRMDKPFELGAWKLNTRVDAPFIRNDVVTRDNPNGDHELGFGDLLFQALLIPPPKGHVALAFGAQVIAPTGTQDQFTGGRWRLVPTVAVIRQLPELSRGSFLGVVVRDDFSFAGESDRAKINVVAVQPIFNWQLRNRWFVTVSPEMKFNTKDDWKPFVPFDVTVGRKIDARTVVSLQADVALVDDYAQYDWQLEFRLGVFF